MTEDKMPEGCGATGPWHGRFPRGGKEVEGQTGVAGPCLSYGMKTDPRSDRHCGPNKHDCRRGNEGHEGNGVEL